MYESYYNLLRMEIAWNIVLHYYSKVLPLLPSEETWDEEKEEDEGQKTDPRPQPEYEINYRQRVTANQIFLPVSSVLNQKLLYELIK